MALARTQARELQADAERRYRNAQERRRRAFRKLKDISSERARFRPAGCDP